jgi:DNA replication protein DnaC
MERIKAPVQEIKCVATPSPKPNGNSSKPPHDLWLGFDAYNENLKYAKRRVAEWFNEGWDSGEALVLAGGYGSGKTHLARVVLSTCMPHMVVMISEPDMLANIRATYDGDGTEKMIMGNYRRAPLLIIDDVGTAHVKDNSRGWLEDIYWRILDRRSEINTPLLMTTNLSLYELGQWIGGRALSRLQGMMGDNGNFVDLFGVDDYRTRGW